MKSFKRVLLYADSNTNVEPAVRLATQIAKSSQGVVTVVDCQALPNLSTDSNQRFEANPDCEDCKKIESAQHQSGSAIALEASGRLAAICDQLRRQGVPATSKILWGKSVSEVNREVLEFGHELLIKTAEGQRANKEKSLFGTTGIHLMRTCYCPVWIVDPTGSDRLSRIVAAVDLFADDTEHSKLNQDVLYLAADIARCVGGSLHVIHARTPYTMSVVSSRMPRTSLDVFMEGGYHSAERRLFDFVAKHDLSVSPTSVKVLRGKPDQAIPNYVSRRNVDLVVMGTIGRRGTRGYVFGNMAETVLRRVQCSVLTTRLETVEEAKRNSASTDNRKLKKPMEFYQTECIP